jgi:hypothetical protein
MDNNQEEELLFELYPDIKKAYDLSQQLRTIYNSKMIRMFMLKLAHWYRKVEESGFKTLISFSIP